jgi:hypothetical protein
MPIGRWLGAWSLVRSLPGQPKRRSQLGQRSSTDEVGLKHHGQGKSSLLSADNHSGRTSSNSRWPRAKINRPEVAVAANNASSN